jgi:hypothetical protein
VSNSTLAARLSALVDKWNGYKNALRDLLTKQTGTVDMEDGMGVIVTLPTFPQLQKNVTALTDAASGAVAGAQAAASSSAMSASASAQSSTEAQAAKDAAKASADAAAASKVATDTVAGAAATSAANSATSATTSADKATIATTQATNSANSATAANASKTAASTSATNAAGSATAAQSSASEAQAWALTAQTTVTGLLHYAGSWNASSNTFPSNPVKGDFWKISGNGVVGGVDLAVGDQIIYSGTGWDKIDNTEQVTSVAGRIGNVVINISDLAGLQASLDSKLPTTTFTGHTHTIATVTGLQTALDAKAPSNNPTLTGAVTLPGAQQPTVVSTGTGDGASYVTFNTRLHLHWGLGIEDYAGTVRGVYDARSGTWDCQGGFKANGQTVWHAGNFNPAGYLPLSGSTMTGDLKMRSVTDAKNIANYAMQSLLVQSDAATAAAMCFLRNGAYAGYFGMDTDNQWKVGGWSMGAASYRVIHEGVTNWNCTGQLSSATYAPTSAGGANISGNGSGMQFNGTTYLAGGVNRLWANSGGWSYQPRIFVGSGDPGAASGDGDLWIW